MAETNALEDMGYSFAYQPILNARLGSVACYEALLRGANNESAQRVLAEMMGPRFHHQDANCRHDAIALAARLGLPCDLSLNLSPNALKQGFDPIANAIEAAGLHGFAPNRLVLEMTEHDMITDHRSLVQQLNAHRGSGVKFAIDDFGAGYAGLTLLAEFQPDIVKIDISLVRDIESKGPRQAIVRGVVRTCLDLGIDVVAEGVETDEEYWWFRDEGVELFQGFLFARPAFEQLPPAFFKA